PFTERPKATHVSGGGFTVRRMCAAACAKISSPTIAATSSRSASPSATSFGRSRDRISPIRGASPGMPNRSKSGGSNPGNCIDALPLRASPRRHGDTENNQRLWLERAYDRAGDEETDPGEDEKVAGNDQVRIGQAEPDAKEHAAETQCVEPG